MGELKEFDTRKKTVVLLAETPEVGNNRHGLKPHPSRVNNSEFVKQSNHWKRKHKEFNVVILPFYADAGKTRAEKDAGMMSSKSQYSLEYAIDQIRIISNTVGRKVTVGFMGHAGMRMGGHPFTKKSKQDYVTSHIKGVEDRIDRLSKPKWSVTSITTSGGKKLGLTKEEQDILRENDIDDIDLAKERINKSLRQNNIEDALTTVSNNIDGVMIGACRMGQSNPIMFQEMSNKLGVPVYAQSGTSWGTGAIEEIGDEPQHKYFVVGKNDSGMKFTPYQDEPTFMLRSTDPKEKQKVMIDMYRDHQSYWGFAESWATDEGYKKNIKEFERLSEKSGFLNKPKQKQEDKPSNIFLPGEKNRKQKSFSDIVFDIMAKPGAF